MSTFDESKIRRGQPANRGQFAAKHNSAPAVSLDAGFGFEDDSYVDPFGAPDTYDDSFGFDAPAPEPEPEPAPVPRRRPARRTTPAPVLTTAPDPDEEERTPIITVERHTLYYGDDEAPAPEKPKAKPSPRRKAAAKAAESNVTPIGNGIGPERMQELALEEMEKHGLIADGWTFEFVDDKPTDAMGTCHYRDKKITIGRNYSRHAPVDHAMDTIRHEVAHALTPGAGHGSRWKWKARAIGSSGMTKTPSPYADYTRKGMIQDSYSIPADAPEPTKYLPGMRLVIRHEQFPQVADFAEKPLVVERHMRKNVRVITNVPFSNGATGGLIPPVFLRAHREGEPLPEGYEA